MPPSGETISGSMGRIERIGPISAGTSDCQTATYRVDTLDQLFEDEVGVLEAHLRPGVGMVVDLRRKEGPSTVPAAMTCPVSGVSEIGAGAT